MGAHNYTIQTPCKTTIFIFKTTLLFSQWSLVSGCVNGLPSPKIICGWLETQWDHICCSVRSLRSVLKAIRGPLGEFQYRPLFLFAGCRSVVHSVRARRSSFPVSLRPVSCGWPAAVWYVVLVTARGPVINTTGPAPPGPGVSGGAPPEVASRQPVFPPTVVLC